jgi:hypothetical protein
MKKINDTLRGRLFGGFQTEFWESKNFLMSRKQWKKFVVTTLQMVKEMVEK